jgi:hypothetical protein
MTPDRTGLRQYAVLWTVTGRDRYGNITVAAPVEIRCRWLEGQEEALDEHGNDIALDATAHVDRLIAPDSLLWLGRLKDVPITFGPLLGTLMQARTYYATPSVKARRVRHKVGLIRYKDTPPS